MLKHNTILLLATLITILFTSCTPKALKEDNAILFAAIAGDSEWVGMELLNYVFQIQKQKNGDNTKNIIPQEGDDWWNITEVLQDVSAQKLYHFLKAEVAPSEDEYPNMSETIKYNRWTETYIANPDRAFKTIYDICGDKNIQKFKKEIRDRVEVFDYRKKDENKYSRVTAYDVVYKVNETTYVRCNIYDLGAGAESEIKSIETSDYFCELEY